jgi:hypothetical protein
MSVDVEYLVWHHVSLIFAARPITKLFLPLDLNYVFSFFAFQPRTALRSSKINRLSFTCTTKSGQLTHWFRKPFIQPRIYKSITMLCYYLTQAGKRLKAAAESIGDRIIGLFRRPEPVPQTSCKAGLNSIASRPGCSMNTGQWSRQTDNHAPIFSLFTYFGDRQ